MNNLQLWRPLNSEYFGTRENVQEMIFGVRTKMSHFCIYEILLDICPCQGSAWTSPESSLVVKILVRHKKTPAFHGISALDFNPNLFLGLMAILCSWELAKLSQRSWILIIVWQTLIQSLKAFSIAKWNARLDPEVWHHAWGLTVQLCIDHLRSTVLCGNSLLCSTNLSPTNGNKRGCLTWGLPKEWTCPLLKGFYVR